MSTEIAITHDRRDMLSVIAEAALNPAVDVAKMQALLDMQERLERRQAEKDFIAAKLALQSELPSIGKRGEIKNKAEKVQSRYSRWEDIERVVRPLRRKHGFELSFEMKNDGPLLLMQAVLSHVGGHIERSGFMPLPRDTSGAKNDIQGVGSAQSYGKRYTTIAILNILTEGEDDDGQTTSAVAEKFSDLGESGLTAAKRGLKAYEEWFKSACTKEERQMLFDSGEHEKLKAIAKENTFPGDA